MVNNNGQEKEVNIDTTQKSAKMKTFELPQALSVRQLAEMLGVSAIDVIKQLMRDGVLANINQVINYDVAAAVVKNYGYQPARQAVTPKSLAAKKKRVAEEKGTSSEQPHRPPVVTIMGHVDHGKTRLLDAIRQTNVMDSEVGGITQHIGAYQVEVGGQKITFLDTPGHEAFTAMRARGAQVTDITILVVAADDGVMPQTLEAIDHARAAGVPILVAINKIDKANANPDSVKKQLSDAGLVIEEWGGDIVCVATSAKNKKGISDVLENLLLLAELEDLRADPEQGATGVVIEANMDRTKGPMATVLVQNGTLKTGETIVVGTTWGRVKAMFNDTGKRVRKAEPSTPVAILGLDSVPEVADALKVVAGEKQARALVQKRKTQAEKKGTETVSLTNIYDKISAGKVKELNIILKADVQGSIEPINNSLKQLGSDKLQIRVIRSAIGNVSDSDVMLAAASKGLIIGFSVGILDGAKQLAENEGIDIRFYDIIYNLIEDMEKALKGLLEPTIIEVIHGRAEVRAVFKGAKKAKIAGCYITEGKINRSSLVRVKRQDEIVAESEITSLRRFKDDINEVTSGYECGVGLKKFNGFKEGDVLELYHKEKSK